jgi:hypothetical protein
MWVTFGHLRPSGHIMPDHGGDRGAALLDLAPHDRLHIKQKRSASTAPPGERPRARRPDLDGAGEVPAVAAVYRIAVLHAPGALQVGIYLRATATLVLTDRSRCHGLLAMMRS